MTNSLFNDNKGAFCVFSVSEDEFALQTVPDNTQLGYMACL
jgi:hypothetical protein